MGSENYVNNSVFDVQIAGITLSFSKISGIGGTAEYDTYVEGGGMMHLLAKPKTSAGTVVFEKGISVLDKMTAGILVPGTAVGDITIQLMKHQEVAERYYIENGFITGWELGELDAMQSAVAVKRITVAHTGIR